MGRAHTLPPHLSTCLFITCIALLITACQPPTPTPTNTSPPTATTTATFTPTATPTPTATITPTPTSTATITPTPTSTPTPTATITPTPTASPLPPTVTSLPPPTITLAPPPTLPPATSTPGGEAICTCQSNSLNCSDFTGQQQAQACYDHCLSVTGSDIHRLDGSDGDGKACESLP